MGPWKCDHNKQLITLTVITLSGFHCIYNVFDVSCCSTSRVPLGFNYNFAMQTKHAMEGNYFK